MTINDIVTAIQDGLTAGEKKESPGFITRQQLARVLGYTDPHNVDPILKNIEGFEGRRYPIRLVAKQMQSRFH